MRESRLSGSVEGVTSNHDPYSDYLLCFEHVDNLGAYSIPSETGLLIPSDFANQRDAQALAISSFNLGVRITAFA